MLAKTIRHPYNWDLGINVPVQTQKWCDHYQNMRIMLAVLRFKKWGKLCSFSQIMLKLMLAQSIKVYSYTLLRLDYYVCNADYEMLYPMSPSCLKFSLPSFIIPFKKCITSPIFLLFERYILHRADLFTCRTDVARFLAYCSSNIVNTVAVLLIIWANGLNHVIFTGRLKIMIIMILLLYWSIPRKKNALPPGSNNRNKNRNWDQPSAD